jgi:hypothetical protein
MLLNALPHTGVSDSVFVTVLIVDGAGLPLYNQPLFEEPRFHKYPVIPGALLVTLKEIGFATPHDIEVVVAVIDGRIDIVILLIDNASAYELIFPPEDQIIKYG